MDITIPNIGDIDEVEVIELCVAEGDKVAEEDAVIVIESDKASMEIPAPAAGVIEAFKVAVGDQVKEGDVIATLSVEGGVDGAKDDSEDESEQESKDDKGSIEEAAESAASDVDEAGDETERLEAAPAAESADGDTGDESEIDVLVPDIGDASGVVVIEVAIKEGDEVAVNDLLVVLESDKASMEIAAEQAGKVMQVAVQVDQEVEEGTLIATLLVTGGSGKSAGPDAVKASQKQPEKKDEDKRDKKGADEKGADEKRSGSKLPPAPSEIAAPPDESEQEVAQSARVYAGPAVRRLARELGVDLTQVKGTGNRNRITKDDVKTHVKSRLTESAEGGGGWPQVAKVDFARFGDVELVDLSRIRRRGAENLHRSWVNLPHVTQHDEADVTELEEFRQSLKQEAERKGVKVTPLAFLIKACCAALTEFPEVNSSLHPDGKRLVVKKYINIGMAVDTPEGLVVPVIHEANRKNIWELSADVAELSAKARDKKLGMDEVQGGTFSISSLGALGGTGFTPIVNAPEVAILGVSKMQIKPLWDGEAFQPRKVLPLSLSYDHRVINGADGGRFMVYLTGLLTDIRRLALE